MPDNHERVRVAFQRRYQPSNGFGHYEAGEHASFPAADADQLVRAGHALYVDDDGNAVLPEEPREGDHLALGMPEGSMEQGGTPAAAYDSINGPATALPGHVREPQDPQAHDEGYVETGPRATSASGIPPAHTEPAGEAPHAPDAFPHDPAFGEPEMAHVGEDDHASTAPDAGAGVVEAPHTIDVEAERPPAFAEPDAATDHPTGKAPKSKRS